MPHEPNRLIQETSPYLLQHAHNPVDWYPWGEEAWNRAKTENKLVIVSIGYSACHWCHVMERESFEDETIAKLMNKDYICIKVDREERPDVDQFFMDAANIMTGRGGWPLNAFALPDGRPVYAGTYFPKTSWTGLLHELASGYKFKIKKYHEYADKLVEGIKGLNLIQAPLEVADFPVELADQAYLSYARLFDKVHGGKGRAPKFPMPDIYCFLLRFNYHTKNEEALNHTLLTLDKMAMGGIYDQIGGGFARYSTDAIWKVPHFEKMLYDNAQLIGLYSEAFSITQNPLYKKIVYQTIEWLKREMLSSDGAFYSALDADSEGEEGKFYVWKEEELDEVLGSDSPFVKELYAVGKEGLWEHGNNILVRTDADSIIAKNFNISLDELSEKIKDIEQKLLIAREKRIRPGLDNKILTSWNALMIKGLLKAYNTFGEEEFLGLAKQNLDFFQLNLIKEEKLFHTLKNGEAAIAGFLEDYAYFIEALINMYEVTFEEKYILEARRLTDIVIEEFYDTESGYCHFTSENNNELASRKIDVSDNVCPSPNSVMAHNLFVLGRIFDEGTNYSDLAKRMLGGVIENIIEHGPFYSNWVMLLLNYSYPFYDVAICGENALVKRNELAKSFIPNKIMIGNTSMDSTLALLEGKMLSGKTVIYTCEEGACGLLTEEIDEVIKQLERTMVK